MFSGADRRPRKFLTLREPDTWILLCWESIFELIFIENEANSPVLGFWRRQTFPSTQNRVQTFVASWRREEKIYIPLLGGVVNKIFQTRLNNTRNCALEETVRASEFLNQEAMEGSLRSIELRNAPGDGFRWRFELFLTSGGKRSGTFQKRCAQKSKRCAAPKKGVAHFSFTKNQLFFSKIKIYVKAILL